MSVAGLSARFQGSLRQIGEHRRGKEHLYLRLSQEKVTTLPKRN